jgi:hypothetical protein
MTFNRVLKSHPHTSMFGVDFVPSKQFNSLFVFQEKLKCGAHVGSEKLK